VDRAKIFAEGFKGVSLLGVHSEASRGEFGKELGASGRHVKERMFFFFNKISGLGKSVGSSEIFEILIGFGN
jgi:hypothetical protein